MIELRRAWAAPSQDDGGSEGRATPFQDVRWSHAWYSTLGASAGTEPLIVTIRDRASSEPALTLGLILRTIANLKIVEFADREVTDCNAPVLGPASPVALRSAAVMWRELCGALHGVDLVRLRKMPDEINGRPNPFALLRAARPCAVNRNIVSIGEDFAVYKSSLARSVRKELERSWRVFTRFPDATFRVATNVNEALDVFAIMEAQQADRMRGLGASYLLSDPSFASFYREVLIGGVDDGYAVITTLTSGNETVAALMGIRRGPCYVMLRHGTGRDRWSNCSPGRLIVDRTMAWLHADGVREFDFSLGNYAYKRRFGVTRVPLIDVTVALSWRGLPGWIGDRGAQWILRHPILTAVARRIARKRALRQEA